MDQDRLSGNPFTALFDSVEKAELYVQETTEAKTTAQNEEDLRMETDFLQESLDVDTSPPDRLLINCIIEKIFIITLDKEHSPLDRPVHLVFLEDMYQSYDKQDWLDTDCLEQAVFERLMLLDPKENVIFASGKVPETSDANRAAEVNTLDYIFHSYVRLCKLPKQSQEITSTVLEKSRAVILLNAQNCFQHPEIFRDLNTAKHFINMFLDLHGNADFDLFVNFITEISVEIDKNDEEGTVYSIFEPVFKDIQTRIQKEVKLGHGTALVYADIVHVFTCSTPMAKALLRYAQPKDEKIGKSFEQTIIGSLLSLSCLPANETGPYEFFENPSRFQQQDHNATELSIQQPTAIMNEKVYVLFRALLKLKGQVQHTLLDWLAKCLSANKGRAQLSQRMMMLMPLGNASDGFFLNLCAVMLRLCRPFSVPYSPKLLKVQPTYCLATAGQREQVRNRNVHMMDLSTETSLVPPPDGENEIPAVEAEYNFISEMFHMTHYCLHLGFHVVHEKFMKLNQELGRAQGLYRDLQQSGSNPSQLQQIKEAVDKRTQMYLTLKAALSEQQMLELCFNFHASTTTYLVQIAIDGSSDRQEFTAVTFPLSENVPNVLSCVPEFVGENVIDFMLFTRRFKDSLYEVMGSALEPLFTFILVFMGNPDRMRNPHLRAHMAEGLEALMPPQQPSQSTLLGTHFFRENLFKTHPHIRELAPTLLSVFCNIEMTGQGVEFEQKFNYRRPMYSILKYIWQKKLHRERVQEISDNALLHIEATSPPVFLRFINLLINDAIFLLDEALSYMAQIKDKEEEKERGDWTRLNARDRQTTENDFRHMGMIARFHNIMGNETITVLSMLTQHIHNVFMHDVMVDRLAAMLNYFLKHLAGDNRKDFRVKDKEKCQFKPVELVCGICQIFLNFKDEEKFCMAVSKDGRSYSHELFLRVKAILVKFHKAEMIDGFASLTDKIKDIAIDAAIEDEATEDAPEEYLDALLSTLMKDPVLLPSSKKVVDRSTISRHVLSDQFDPFNRQPLTMDMVIPQPQLKQQIQGWLVQWKTNRKQSESAKNESESTENEMGSLVNETNQNEIEAMTSSQSVTHNDVTGYSQMETEDLD